MAGLAWTTWLLAAASIFVAVQLVVAAVNAVAFPRLRAPVATPHPDAARTSILLPVRDEMAHLPGIVPALLAQGAAEVLVLDDGSTDGSGAWLEAFAAEHEGVRVLRGTPLPDGWTGKAWACAQLAEAARGELLLFTDADVRWKPGSLASVLDLRARHRAGFASVWPRQVLGTVAERIAVPQVDVILLGALPWPLVAATPFAALAAGNGQCLLFRRDVYDAIGGHAAVRDELLEDVRLGQRAKATGARVALGLGGAWLETRMYDGAAAVIEGFGKNTRSAAGGATPLLAWTAPATLAYFAAWPLAVLDPRWLAVGLAGWLLRALVDATAGRSPRDAPLQSWTPLLAWPIALRALSRRGVTWKGRRYP